MSLALCTPAHADSDDPDREIAQRHFENGRAFYAANDYVHALEEFEAAHKVKPIPALEFNIARCHDRLEHPAEALAAYERYLAAAPDAVDAGEVRERVRLLRTRLNPLPAISAAKAVPAAAPSPSSRRRVVVAVTVSLVAALVIGGSIGLGVGLTQGESYSLGTIRVSK